MTHENSIRARFALQLADFRLDVSLDLPGKGVTALFGHSGSGKTTLLRCMAGLERSPQGFLRINGDVWQDEDSQVFVPTHQRSLGYVFQEASLFEHLSVRENLEYGQRRVPAAERRVSLDLALELLGIGDLLERRPRSLSGGERQRVGIARALLTSPKLLLMDEPLAALDHKRKGEIMPYLERLHEELEIPVLYVSHSPDEVARLADHLVLLENGAVIASGSIQETMARLDLPGFFADEAGVVLETLVGTHEEADFLTRLDFPGGHLHVAQRLEPRGRNLRVRVQARDVSLLLNPPGVTSVLNVVFATVVDFAETANPAHIMVRLDAGGVPLLARITRRSLKRLKITSGQRLWAQIKAVALLE